jgi:colanic acid/amylovoran biosynthesis glycosyltransferase
VRIAVLAAYFPAVSQTFVLGQVAGLLARGHDVHVFARRPRADQPRHPEARRAELLARVHHDTGIFDGSPEAPAAEPLRHGPFDVVLCHFGEQGVRAQALRDRGVLQAPLVTAFHGFDLHGLVRQKGEGFYRRLFACGERMLPVSEHGRDALLRLGCPAAKVRVHHMGIDCSTFAFAPRRIGPDGRIRLLSVARLVEKKGLANALHAFAHVRHAFAHARHAPPDLEYHIVGDGVLRESLERRIGELALGGSVFLHGWRDQDEVRGLLARAHVLLAPSVTASDGDQEGIPVALMEAMACGLPVLATRHGGIPELVLERELLAPEGDVDALAARLLALVSRPERWEELGRRGRRVVEDGFDLDAQNEALERHLEEVAEAARSGRRVLPRRPMHATASDY